MNFNNEHQEIINNVGVTNPFVAFMLSVLLLFTGNSLPEVSNHVTSFEIPKGWMQVGQLIAWYAAGGLFLLSLARFVIDTIRNRNNKKADGA